MSTKHTLRVTLRASYYTVLEVERDEGEDPTQLTDEEFGDLVQDAELGGAEWDVDYVYEVKK